MLHLDPLKFRFSAEKAKWSRGTHALHFFPVKKYLLLVITICINPLRIFVFCATDPLRIFVFCATDPLRIFVFCATNLEVIVSSSFMTPGL